MKIFFYTTLFALACSSVFGRMDQTIGDSSRKIALVVGVADYVYATPLKNPLHDARDMADNLNSMGFKVTMLPLKEN